MKKMLKPLAVKLHLAAVWIYRRAGYCAECSPQAPQLREEPHWRCRSSSARKAAVLLSQLTCKPRFPPKWTGQRPHAKHWHTLRGGLTQHACDGVLAGLRPRNAAPTCPQPAWPRLRQSLRRASAHASHQNRACQDKPVRTKNRGTASKLRVFGGMPTRQQAMPYRMMEVSTRTSFRFSHVVHCGDRGMASV